MTDMRNAEVCWAPECGNVPPESRGSRPSRYCSGRCRVRAVRRNGGKAPSAPYPPLEPSPLQQDATSVSVVTGSEQQAGGGPERAVPKQPGGSDADVLGQQAPVRRGGPVAGNVTPPAVATAGKAPAPVRSSSGPPTSPAAPPEGEGAGGTVNPDTPAPKPEATVTQLHLAITENATVPVEIVVHPMVAAYKRDLERMGHRDTRQGQQITAMAEKLVSSATSPTAAANLSKELERLMAALEESAPKPEDQSLLNPAEVIRERTIAKLRSVAG